MNTHSTPLRSFLALGVVACAANLSPALAQQVAISVDWMGPLVGQFDTTYSFPITEGDTLIPGLGSLNFGPLPNPRNEINAGFFPGPAGLGLPGHAPCVGHLGGTPCLVEVDALSYGNEPLTGPGSPINFNLAFSVDRQARGIPFLSPPPTVFSEATWGDAAADVFLDIGQGVGPLAPFAASTPGNIGAVDGDGLISGSGALYRGFGLTEPASPAATLPNPGDNLDALASLPAAGGFPAGGVYFSLDDLTVDPFTGIPNSGSAQANGFLGGDVLYAATPGGPAVVWAAANQLGLNLSGALDDLDALILRENGTGVFEPSLVANDWMGGATDMLLFSVRRGSALIGIPDSIFGIPICEGDILTTPQGAAGFPGIYIAAENLGLMTQRGPGMISDDLDALDLRSAPFNDCNGNGIDDAIDIVLLTSWDINSNGIPDECELLTTPFCHCNTTAPAPCANFYPPGGCQNSTTLGAILAATSGTTSVSSDNLVLTTTQMPINKVGLMFMSQNTIAGVPFFDGIRCLKAPLRRLPPKNSGPSGSFSYGTGIVASTGFIIVPGSTWNFQSWYRDPFGPCGFTANISNAIQAQFTP